MPLLTYYNLSEDKKEKIIKASLEEFAFKDYENASLTSIIKEVGVAKGSFYRYFKNKYDLYTFLVSLARETQNEFMQESQDHSLGFASFLFQKYSSRVQFSVDHPHQCRLLCNMIRERNSKELDAMLSKTQKSMMKEVLDTIEQYQFKGEIRADLDRDLLAYQVIMQEYAILNYLGFKYQKRVKGSMVQIPLSEVNPHEIQGIIQGFVEMITGGAIFASDKFSTDLLSPVRRQRN